MPLDRAASSNDSTGRPEVAGRPLFDSVGDQFLSYYADSKGGIRGEVVRSNLRPYLARDSRVLDLGCGEGRDTAWLAAVGCSVVGCDASLKMLGRAGESVRQLPSEVRDRISLLRADEAAILDKFGVGSFDLIVCHGVIMYQADEHQFLDRLLRLLRPGGRLSLLARNIEALSFRPAAEHRYREALALLRSPVESPGRLGVIARNHSVSYLADYLENHDVCVDDWFGVKIFSDNLEGQLAENEFHELLDLEVAASRLDPYRSCARLVHLVGRKVR